MKCCPLCSEPISGVARYGRITKKVQMDLDNMKFTYEIRDELRLADRRLEGRVTANSNTRKALKPIYQRYSAILAKSQKSPVRQVGLHTAD
jgi:hypothetical protein